MLKDSRILITGGTGSFGKKFIKMTLEEYPVNKIIVYSRDEMKQWHMSDKFRALGLADKLEFAIGDVRDQARLKRVMDGVDYVIHAAATKIVPTAEYNPFEAIKTNINGAMNVIEAAKESDVKKVVALSTDKACNPVNLYGATKLASDKLFVAANLNSKDCSFSVVRYGNVMGSRGSVIPFFLSLDKSTEFPITDEKMTRFMISIEQGVKLVWHALTDSIGGEIYVHKIPSMRVIDVARAIDPERGIDIIGVRPGEKIHEMMINEEDAVSTYEYSWYYKILPTIENWHQDSSRIKDGQKLPIGFIYSSGNNSDWMQPETLTDFIKSQNFLELQEFNI